MKTIVLAKQGSHSLASRTFQDFPEPPPPKRFSRTLS